MIKRRDRILIAALELLEQGGVSNVTTKNLAAKQNISEPALYRHFKNKQDIFEAMIEEFFSYDQKIMNTVLEHNMKGREAVIYYVTRYAELYQSYSELASILYSFDLYYYNKKTKKTVRDILKNRDEFLMNQLKKYPVDSSKRDIEMLAIQINELVFSEVFRWKINDKKYTLTDVLVDRVSKLLEK